MGYTPCQSAPSRGRLPVDAPKRYGFNVPKRPTSWIQVWVRVQGLPQVRVVGFVVPVLCLVLSLCLPSVVPSWGSSPEPCLQLFSVLSPRDSGLHVRSFPTRVAHTTGAAPDLDREDGCPA